jgi:hypothetical protein
MGFVLLCVLGLVALGIVAAIASHFQGGSDEIMAGHDCSSCSAKDEGQCKIACLLEEKKQREDNKTAL